MSESRGCCGADKFVPPRVSAPGGALKLLLHCCCAPCSCAIVETLLANGIRPAMFFFNPNIFPYEEYAKRREECRRHAGMSGLEFIEASADYPACRAAWLDCVRGFEREPERGARCARCFEFRLRAAAAFAAENGFGCVATTLSSSRWKDLGQIGRAGESAVSAFPGIEFWGRNWRKEGLQNRRNALIKQFGFYNQQYCGCEFSMKKQNSMTEETTL